METHTSKRNKTNNLQPQHLINQVFNNPVLSNSEQNRDVFRENYSRYFHHANYNQTQPIPPIQIHPYYQIMETHGSNRYPTNNLRAHHHLDRAINNPISSNSEQIRDAFGGKSSNFFNHQNYKKAQPFSAMQSYETGGTFLPKQKKMTTSFLLNFLLLNYLTTTETRWPTTTG